MRWLEGELPGLVSSGVISAEAAESLKRHYQATEERSNLGFVLLATVGSALVAAGIILLIAHNWDDMSRPVRTAFAFLPLILVQALAAFVLLRRSESQPWRETAAIFDVAAVGTSIALVSQTYQIQGSFSAFILIWLLLSLPIVYLFQTTFGASAYIIGTVVWLTSRFDFGAYHRSGQMFFWLLLALIVPYYARIVRDVRFGYQFKALSILLVAAMCIGLGMTLELVHANLGPVAFAGFVTAVYLFGMALAERDEDSLNVLSILGAIGIGIISVIGSFDDSWHLRAGVEWQKLSAEQWIATVIQMLFPLTAILLAGWIYWRRQRFPYSIAAALLPLIAIVGWITARMATDGSGTSGYSSAAAALFNVYALLLGIELLARGIRAGSIARANFGLAVIAALALARFFDSDMSFVARGVGFIVVGAGFLLTNVILFRKRAATT